MEIVNFFYELARQCLPIKGFGYGRNTAKGAGNEVYPLVWLDDPILFNSNTQGNPPNSTGDFTVNLDFLDIPDKSDPNKNVALIQARCLTYGLLFMERIRQLKEEPRYALVRWTAISVSEYYDNNAAGWRFTVVLTRALPLLICDIDLAFSKTKTLVTDKPLPNFAVDNPEGCAVFSDKAGLPKFDITI